MLLELAGYTVEVAYTGPDGLEAARRVPAGRGAAATSACPGHGRLRGRPALREDPATADARLIALTGYGQEEDQRQAREAGFDHHLTKPVDPPR